MLLQCPGGPTDRVLLINLDQPVHFGSYMLRRAILVERSIRTCRIVRVFLICALLKLCFERSPELVEHNDCVLITEECRMKLFYVTRQKKSWIDSGSGSLP